MGEDEEYYPMGGIHDLSMSMTAGGTRSFRKHYRGTPIRWDPALEGSIPAFQPHVCRNGFPHGRGQYDRLTRVAGPPTA